MINKSNNQRGFTLIEMLVSIALFATVVTTSVGTLLVLIDANAKAQSIQVAVNNLSFALDSMTRLMRTGTEFYCAANQASLTTGSSLRSDMNDCPGSNSAQAIAFTDTRTGDRIGFAYNSSDQAIERKIDPSGGGTGSWLDLTGSNIQVTQLDFWVGGTDNIATGNPLDTNQPAVTIYLEAEVGDATGLGTEYQIQTTVTQRKYDI